MLRYNFKNIFKARGIDKPYAYLVNAGFSSRLASSMNRNEVKVLRLDTLEKVCLTLNCTPNDLLEWHPDPNQKNTKNCALQTIKAKDASYATRLNKLLLDLPLNQITEIENFIEKQKKGNPKE
ncbi:helix-turn-helix domain-containing protein [Aquimarina sediminis]|uniref:helix-turn-helix domain-containing protein n=1 Tax=Aquimarina sediminis TaxID=2070536 RepID=UPI000CA075DF|nr:helix-turn-helix transcriptional regulator [Aquimarina sediminis]